MMPRAIAWAGALLAAALSPLVAADLASYLRLGMEIERELAAADLDAYHEVRSQEDQALQRANDLARRLDDLLAEPEVDVAELESFENALALARETARQAGDRAGELRRRIYERHRRLALMGDLLHSQTTVAGGSDPVSGRWQVRILPLDQLGTFDLELDGTLVRGSYRLDGGFAGSLRGTFVGGALTLERIDAERGFDVVFEGRLDAGGDRVDGDWRTTRLSDAGPAGGQWVAVRAPSDRGTP